MNDSKTALFTNFSTEIFTGFWNGKGRNFNPGQSLYLPDYLARHFAKHLVNRELLKLGKERDTSPKVKMRADGTEYIDNEVFNEMFSKAYTPDDSDALAPNGERKDSIDVAIETANKNRTIPEEAPADVQVIPSVDNDDEDGFGANNPNNQ